MLSVSTLFPVPPRPDFGIFVGRQMAALVARGIDLTMVNPIGIPPWPLARREPYAGLAGLGSRSRFGSIAVHHPHFRTYPLIGVDSNPRRIARAILPLARRLHAERPFDVIDAQFFFPDGPAAAAIARELGLPLSIKARGADIHYWGRRPKARDQMLDAAARSTGLLAVSQALKDDMIALGMPGERIAVHHTGLDHARFRPMDRAAARATLPGLPPVGTPLLATVGALIPRKGQHFVIAALPTLPGAHLAVAGKGDDEDMLRALALRLGVTDRVHFLGQVAHDDLPTLYAGADVMVLPSASEGLANAWVEALACGAPVVIPDIGGAREVVDRPAAGRIAARDAQAIAEAVRAILSDPPLSMDTAASAARFSWERNAEALEAHYRGMIAAGSSQA